MINTRILEQRLGWRAPVGSDGAEQPENRPLRHEALLQGRIRTAPGRPRQRRADVEAAWAALPMVAPSAAALDPPRKRLSALDRHSVAGSALDELRTQMLRVVQGNGWRRIGITSPTRGCGRSFISSGLAASVARLENLRVLLLDMDLAAPGLAHVLGVTARGSISDNLVADRPIEEWVQRIGDNLALALNDTTIDNGADLVQNPDLLLGLRALIDTLAPDLVIHDMPPLLNNGAATAFLPQLDAVLLVTDGTRTMASEVAECERLLDGQAPLLGVILNKSDDTKKRRR